MNKLQEMQKAKSFLEMLAQSINPVTLQVVNDGVLKEKEIVNTFFFVAKILEEIMANGGEVVAVNKPLKFEVERIDLKKISTSDSPLQIDAFVRLINKQVDKKIMKGLPIASVRNWLIDQGFVSKRMETTVKNVSRYYVTESAENAGVLQGNKTNKRTGEIESIILIDKNMQDRILNNLSTIANVKGTSIDEVEDDE